MTALARAGAESRHTNLAGSAVLTAAFELGACEARGAPTVDTTHQHKIKVSGVERGGEACWKFSPNAAEQAIHAPGWFTGAKEAFHYFRIAYRVEGAIAGTRVIGRIYVTEGELAASIEVTSANKIILKNGAGTVVAEVTNGLNTAGMENHNGYHIFELALWVHTSNKETCKGIFWWDGVEVHKNEATYVVAKANAPAGARVGWLTAEPTSATLYVDDMGVNNASGAANNGRLGTTTVLGYLDPVADSARSNMTGGAGGTTELWKANDDPPEGVATGSKSNTSQIYSTTSSTSTVFYEPKLESYSTLGVQAADKIKVIRALAYAGRVTTLHSFGIQSISNPAITEVTTNTTGADVGAFPTGWIMGATAFVDEPSPTLGTEPVLKVRKNTATASEFHVCYMALLVEWEPLAGGTTYQLAGKTVVEFTPKALTLFKVYALASKVVETFTAKASGILKVFGLASKVVESFTVTPASLLVTRLIASKLVESFTAKASGMSGSFALASKLVETFTAKASAMVGSLLPLAGKLTEVFTPKGDLKKVEVTTHQLAGKTTVSFSAKASAMLATISLAGKLTESFTAKASKMLATYGLAGYTLAEFKLRGAINTTVKLAGKSVEEFVLRGALKIIREVLAFEAPSRPPIGHDVIIETVSGATFRLTANGPALRRPQNVSFSTVRGDGYATASVTLNRPIFRDWADLNLLDTWKIVSAGGEIHYEGRLVGMPRSTEDGGQIVCELTGWMSYLKTKKITPLIIDRRLSIWEEPTTARLVALTAASYDTSKSVLSANNDPSGQPSLTVTFNTFTTLATEIGEWIAWAGGEAIGYFRADYIVPKAGGEVGGLMYTTPSDLVPSFINSVGLTLTPTAGMQVAGSTAALYAGWSVNYPGGYSGGSAGDTYGMANPRLIGDHGLTHIGTSPNEGYGLTDVMQHLLERHYPKLRWGGKDNAFALRQASWIDNPSFGYDIFQQLNDLVLWELNCFEDRTIYFEPADLTSFDWIIKTSDVGVTTNFQGDTITGNANGVQVSYTDLLSGRTKTLLPSDHDELVDPNLSNPANIYDEENWIAETVPFPCYEGEALALGTAYLSEYNRPKRSGSFTVSGGWIRNGSGQWRPSAEVRCSDSIGVMDNYHEIPRLITATDYDEDSHSLTITTDAPPSTIEAIQARALLALEAANIGGG